MSGILNLRKRLIQRHVVKKFELKKQQPKWLSTSFPAQTAFIEDPARLKAAHCTRRAGKSYGCGLYLFKEAWENPGVTCLYIALTRDTAKKIMWKDILKTIDRDFGLGCKFNEQDLSVTLPNGSIIYLAGADARTDEMAKFLGQKIKLVIIDEAGKYRIDLENLIFDVLKPAVADYLGTIAMIGTASNQVQSFFARTTRGEVSSWAVHRWSAVDNPHMVEQFNIEMADLKERYPGIEKTPKFRQNYLGEWVVDEASLVYRYTDAVKVKRLPETDTHILGVSLSYKGKTTLAVLGYTKERRETYVVECIKIRDSMIHRALEEIAALDEMYQFASIVSSDASKRLTKELRDRYSVQIREVSSKDKHELIELFNAELAQNNIKVLDQNADLLTEWDELVWDDGISQVARKREHPACENLLSSSVLYAWQQCQSYMFTPTKGKEWIDEYWEKYAARLDVREAGEIDESDGAFQGDPFTSW